MLPGKAEGLGKGPAERDGAEIQSHGVSGPRQKYSSDVHPDLSEVITLQMHRRALSPPKLLKTL